ncbi:hypothetical protein BM1_10018 [Bipolaris maydis]|nr:hypothetical protein BM1_10018 [Bipolaris maydis]
MFFNRFSVIALASGKDYSNVSLAVNHFVNVGNRLLHHPAKKDCILFGQKASPIQEGWCLKISPVKSKDGELRFSVAFRGHGIAIVPTKQ